MITTLTVNGLILPIKDVKLGITPFTDGERTFNGFGVDRIEFAHGHDWWITVASWTFDIEAAEVTKSQRSWCKRNAYAFMYTPGSHTIVDMIAYLRSRLPHTGTW